MSVFAVMTVVSSFSVCLLLRKQGCGWAFLCLSRKRDVVLGLGDGARVNLGRSRAQPLPFVGSERSLGHRGQEEDSSGHWT